MKKRLLLPVLLLALHLDLFAFAKHGHMATGSLAYQLMSPADRDAIAAILEHHPFVSGPWAPLLAAPSSPNISRGEKLFMLAAAWPDEVRSAKWKKKYHHATWHYVNLAYSAGAAVPGASIGGDLLKQLPIQLKAAKQATSLEDRAIAICWLIHQTGDLHQPLHVVALVNDDYPQGDRGGNLFFVKTKPDNSPTYLHALWDNASPRKYTDFAGVHENAIKLKNDINVPSLPQFTGTKPDAFEAIAKKEGFPYAAKYAYLNGTLQGATEHEAEEDPDEVPVVPNLYSADVGRVTYSQLALAGHRIAKLLATVAH
ncbi:MAG: S1/P1 nuclease [Candidatus Didemnitutus sp.]|nr:S1/P1 nuclease [Candidatus Didemnitutus sp.]